MILLALLLGAQDMPPAAPGAVGEAEYEIVVSAVYGRTTMLFDKGTDGKLRNCRVMVSSGSDRRDAAACLATPVCASAAASDGGECVALVSVEPLAPAAAKPPAVFEMPQLAMPKKPLEPGTAGPSATAAENDENERQRVKLPPLPKPPSDAPVITFGNGSKD